MRKWIYEKLNGVDWWWSYYPNLLLLGLNSGILSLNLYSPSEIQLLSNGAILAGSIGITFSLRNIYTTYQRKKERSQFRSTMDRFMQSLMPGIQQIMEEEMTVADRDEQESLQIAQEKILFLIQSESERRKIGLTVSNSDKT